MFVSPIYTEPLPRIYGIDGTNLKTLDKTMQKSQMLKKAVH
jgi:hypothetical protein